MPTDQAAPHGSPAPGSLFVVATPIGHMEDITLRALKTLEQVAVIAAEDTRHTRKLLTRHQISTPLVSYHDHNKEKRTPELLKRLEGGDSIALVTDAGTPSVSDPGYYLVRAAIGASIPVVPVPGVSAFVAALSVSGLPTDSFLFVGFVPRKSAKRRHFLKGLKEEPRTLIFYESPGRLLGLMGEIIQIIGDRQAVVARELTKIHEEILRGSASEIAETLAVRPAVKGEVTLLVEGWTGEREVDKAQLLEDFKRLYREKGRSFSDAVKEISGRYSVSRRMVYEEALKLKEEI